MNGGRTAWWLDLDLLGAETPDGVGLTLSDLRMDNVDDQRSEQAAQMLTPLALRADLTRLEQRVAAQDAVLNVLLVTGAGALLLVSLVGAYDHAQAHGWFARLLAARGRS